MLSQVHAFLLNTSIQIFVSKKQKKVKQNTVLLTQDKLYALKLSSVTSALLKRREKVGGMNNCFQEFIPFLMI